MGSVHLIDIKIIIAALWSSARAVQTAFPPLQDPENYNLVQVLEQVKKMGTQHPSR
jgi:hypothetical protein